MRAESWFEEWERDYRRQERHLRSARRRLCWGIAYLLLGVAVSVVLWSSLGWPALCVGSCVSCNLMTLLE